MVHQGSFLDTGSASAQARRLLSIRERRLHELEGLLRLRVAEATDPTLQRALSQVEEALTVGSPAEALSLQDARHHSAPPCHRAASAGASAPTLGCGLAPRSPRSTSSRRSSLQLTARRNSVSILATTAQSPGASAACKDIEEILASAPARAAQCLKSGFMKLLGELHVLEQRLMSQTKAGEELWTALAKLPALSATQQRLQESEDEYHSHIQRLSTRNTSDARRLVEVDSMAHMHASCTSELLTAVDQLRQDRLKVSQEPKPVAGHAASLAELRAALVAKASLLARLERELPHAQRIMDENKALNAGCCTSSATPEAVAQVDLASGPLR
eukprot:CAMPEP_0175486986 /NCGR_PEP_ID=MMETSP0095-20121207/81310_1 /TAXON_ID=311494 /ORGANISM="Alexandrium monilatum, Strain CCMP3105" /LENGTH=329 /DNA_ID=CAMNT_0016788791 /DNA_START=55 /DNA_END=1042 /DNA_ORIENTATION=-